MRPARLLLAPSAALIAAWCFTACSAGPASPTAPPEGAGARQPSAAVPAAGTPSRSGIVPGDAPLERERQRILGEWRPTGGYPGLPPDSGARGVTPPGGR
jgi:hypothetical protein